jgi:hypothetical protein
MLKAAAAPTQQAEPMPDETKSRNTYVASGPQAGEYGLDGEAVKGLLQGAVLKGRDPLAILRSAAIDASVYGNPHAAINGPALVRLVRQIQTSIDDVYLGFLGQGCRMVLETERE